MKTTIIILFALFAAWILFFKITDYLCGAKNSSLRRFWDKHLVDFGDPVIIPDVKFNHIKPVIQDYKIRVFSNFGAYICDINVCGHLGADTLRIGQACEIAYIEDNFLLVYNQLKNHEK